MRTTRPCHLCPVWVGYLLANPLRALFQRPETILAPHVASGMLVLDVGSAMGFFSLPLARLVGPNGRVVCIDLQQRMLDVLERRADRASLRDRIEVRLCRADSVCVSDLHGQAHFALLFAVVHEVNDPERFFSEISHAMRPEGRVFFAEPRSHVREGVFRESLSMAERSGFRQERRLKSPWSRAVLLEKREAFPRPPGHPPHTSREP